MSYKIAYETEINNKISRQLKEELKNIKKENEKLKEQIILNNKKVDKFNEIKSKGRVVPIGTTISEKTGCLILKSGYKWKDKSKGKAVPK